jgi:riboflavin kinase/FMN adenylyltransferase
MKVFRSLPPPDARTPCALAIGNFDGVHRGHKALLAKVREAAQRLNIVSAVMTFQPHPREYFARLSGDLSGVPPTIANLRDKLLAFSCAGMDRVVVEHFAGRFAALSADEFIEDILVKGMQIKWLIVGEDFCFGANRAGRIPELRQAAARYGFELAVMTEVQSEGERISSSLIRDALAEGDFRRTAGLLGHPYAISGRVIHGQRLGRDLGFPTLNLRMPQAFPVLTGIFITRVHGLAAEPLPAVSCIGSRHGFPSGCVREAR